MKVDNKHILVISHQLSRTGAPIVLLDLVKEMKAVGCCVDVISMLDGELREELSQLGITVQICVQFLDVEDKFRRMAEGYDLVLVNTLVTYEAIHALDGADVPVIWWLHEGKQQFDFFEKVLPDFTNLEENIHVFSVEHSVQNVLMEKYNFPTEILHFVVNDIKCVLEDTVGEKRQRNQKIQFLTVGTYSKVKAQDVLADAICLLSEEVMEQVEFHFYGNDQNYEEEVFEAVERLTRTFPNVFRHAPLPREKMLTVMNDSDCLIVPSRSDSVPTVAVEIMMVQKLCLCTNACGIAHYITDNVNGFTVPPEDAVALAEKIAYIVQNISNLSSVCGQGRLVYEQYFSTSVIRNQVHHLLNQYINVCSEVKMFPKDFFSACIIAKNEEDNIGRCLKYLCRLGIEVVVVDTGSTDCTREIALKYTPYVYGFSWSDDFSAARNFAISKAKGHFIINIDCDEFIESHALNQLYQELSRHPERVGRIKIKNVIHDHGHKMIREEWVSRIFSKELYQYEGRIHEQITAKDGSDFLTFQAPVEVLHTGYDLSEGERELKSKRNIQLLLLEKQLLEISNEYDKLPYILYQLGKAYYLEHSYQEACDYFSQGLSFDLNPELEYVIDMVETYGYSLVNAGRAAEALFFENIYEEFGKTADFHFLMGIIYMNNELFEQAIKEFLEATNYTEGRTQGVNSYIAFYNIGVIYECTGNVKQALAYFEHAGEYQPAKEGIERLQR